MSHQSDVQWRGVAIGVSQDIFDCTTDRTSCSHGAAWVVRLRSSRCLVVGSFHLPTGVPVAQYYAAAMACKKMLRGWHEDLPCVLGVDSNVELLWNRAEARDAEGEIGFRASGKVDKFLEMASGCRLRPVAPRMEERWVLRIIPATSAVDAEIRHTINTDHAMLRCTVEVQRTHGGRWKDGRPRWVVDADKLFSPDSWDDVKRMAQTCTAPRRAGKFVDDMETKELIAEAKNQRGVCAKDLWKRIHSMRKNKRRSWKRSRVASILAGNWHAYRELKRESSKRNWWGRLLHETSARQVGVDVQKHLEGKIFDPSTDWDGQLRKLVDAIPCPENDFVPITSDEVARALTGMRASSSLGPDKIGVDLLRCLHARCPHELACLFSDVLRTGCLPADWGASLLALLPKTQWPRSVAELRPIAMSSAAFKTLSRVVMERSFDQLRFGCPWSSSGRNRGCADMHGAMSRLRDMVREWRLGVVVVKLDIRGAFDCVHREEVANFLIERIQAPYELRFLLQVLGENVLEGCAPGGAPVRVRSNRGIRQGSPESAEIFGLIISDVICRLKCSGSWRKPGPPLDDMPADVGCYQDDIFLWGECPRRLAHNVDLIAQELKKLGLSLATEKTGVVASKYYRGRRTIHVAGQDVAFREPGSSLRILGLDFDFDAPAHQQAKELMSRVWTAFHANKVILCGVGSRKEKAAMVCKLIEGCWSRCAGALHWEKDDLASMNSMQLRILRLCFGCRRGHDEDWVSYNSRASALFAIMARRGSCLFWAAVCGLVLGCVLGVVDDGTTQVDVPSMDSNTATSTLESLPVDVTASVPLRDHDESGCASSLGVPPTFFEFQFFHYNLAYVFGFFEFQYFELLVLVFVSGMVAHKFYDDFLYWRVGRWTA
ncbi:Retrovirus-related Pol polyprotein from type-1 retrotransposable element R2 [Symbiodinium microadriaticum]|uniref:Retrovirus-related Pol polyprotein from type-1 retrotransposable element R2 n=1 Tax=Symbiodinium microadriaticum TaxID=2951 RepID=A0A1Q9EGA2_SYMMI|nr:Retrovirus-related Pol polyprotein from type-1 retrotransposable element R2 [Symbiodinium microadriaticum]